MADHWQVAYVVPVAFSYRVSLQVRHPNVDPGSTVSAIGLSPVSRWAVGERRATPKGTLLPGTYGGTYCAFNLGHKSDGQLTDLLRDALDRLEHAATFIAELRRTGGKLNFLISWFLGDHGQVFNVELLAVIARIGIDLGIEPVRKMRLYPLTGGSEGSYSNRFWKNAAIWRRSSRVSTASLRLDDAMLIASMADGRSAMVT